MNIGIDLRCLQSPYRTGVGEYAFELLHAVLKLDHTNQYFLFFNSFGKATKPHFDYPNAHNTEFDLPNKLFNISSRVFGLPKIDELIKNKFKLDKLDYFFSPNLNFTSLTKNTKHILTIHDLTFELFPNCLTLKQRLWHSLTEPKKQCQNAELILTPSENTKRDLVANYNLSKNKIQVIYPGISETILKNEEAGSNALDFSQNYLLFLGTIEPRKNIEKIVTAFENAEKFLPKKYDLVIAGAPGWKNNGLFRQILNSPLRDRIKIIGYIPDEKKLSLYQNAALFIYPSLYEGFGIPVLEAMHSRLPVITSNRSSLPELTRGSAHLANPLRSEEISEAIVKILNDVGYHEDLARAGRERALDFRWENAAKKFLAILK